MFEFLTVYGLLALTHLFTQINFSHREFLNSVKYKEKNAKLSIARIRQTKYFRYTAAIIIPTYNEDVKELDNCVQSALNQHYSDEFKVIVIDDGSTNKQAINYIQRKYRSITRLYVLDYKNNRGKRHAQKSGFDFVDEEADIIVTIDSDTVLAPDCLEKLVQQFDNPQVGAITGNVRAFRVNLLSRLIDSRYWTAFNQERAAQSLFGTVLCCSGPLAAYRNTLIQKVKEKYITQSFLGQYCTYGDDRHLTNLILEQGFIVKYERQAKAWTHVPTKISGWLRQQARWNRSFYREMFWTLKRVVIKRHSHNIYMSYDLAMQAILPILLVVSLIFVCTRSMIDGPLHLFGYLTILIGIALLRGTYAFLRTYDANFFLFPLYAFCHIFLLIPVRVYALCTLKTTKWGTR